MNSFHGGVTIGIPLYNEEDFIEATVLSAVHQCDELVISDNCSTDHSYSICEKLAKQHSNIRIIRHTKNHGAFYNFHCVLENAKTPFFMWLGAHDLLPKGTVERLKSFLQEDSTATLAYGAADHIDREGNFIARYEYSFADSLSDKDPMTRLLAIIKYLDDCSLIHGLFHAERLRSIWANFSYLGGDHTLLAKASLTGKFLYNKDVSLIRRNPHLHDSPSEQLRRINGAGRNEGIPLYQEMQATQYEIVVQQCRYLGLRAFYYRARARYLLIMRFGPFHENGKERYIDQLCFQFFRTISYLKRLMSRVYRTGPFTASK